MDPKFPSEDELLDGKCADGSKPPLHSREMYEGPQQPFSKEPALPPVADIVQSEQEKDAEQLHYEIDLQLLSDLELCAEVAREMVEYGRKGMRSGVGILPAREVDSDAGVPRGAGVPPARDVDEHSPEPALDASTFASVEQAEALKRQKIDISVPKLAAEPYKYANTMRSADNLKVAGVPDDGPTPEPEPERQPRSSAKGGDRQPADPDKPLSRAQCMSVAERGMKMLIAVSAKRAEVAHRLVDASTKLDIRKAFMQDRAVAVVHGLLLHLEQEWRQLGFGAWMPFRYPDQWLSFCGLLRRVLAANGLIHGKHADTYRKLLDETPPVALEGTLKDRIKESKTPLNPARCKSNQGAETMSELKTRLQSEVWGPKAAFRKFWDNQWAKEQAAPP